MGQLLSFSKQSLRPYMRSKLTIKGVAAGLNRKAGRRVATYHRSYSRRGINKALNAGHLVLLETGSPIHTNVLYRTGGHTYHLDHGKVTKVDSDKLIKKATKSSIYRGWVDIRG